MNEHPHLTAAERRVFALLADASPVKDIAAVLCVSESTIRTHVRNVQMKLGLRNMPELIRAAVIHQMTCCARTEAPDSESRS